MITISREDGAPGVPRRPRPARTIRERARARNIFYKHVRFRVSVCTTSRRPSASRTHYSHSALRFRKNFGRHRRSWIPFSRFVTSSVSGSRISHGVSFSNASSSIAISRNHELSSVLRAARAHSLSRKREIKSTHDIVKAIAAHAIIRFFKVAKHLPHVSSKHSDFFLYYLSNCRKLISCRLSPFHDIRPCVHLLLAQGVLARFLKTLYMLSLAKISFCSYCSLLYIAVAFFHSIDNFSVSIYRFHEFILYCRF